MKARGMALCVRAKTRPQPTPTRRRTRKRTTKPGRAGRACSVNSEPRRMQDDSDGESAQSFSTLCGFAIRKVPFDKLGLVRMIIPMMAAHLHNLPRHYYTLEEYFALEHASDARYEY